VLTGPSYVFRVMYRAAYNNLSTNEDDDKGVSIGIF